MRTVRLRLVPNLYADIEAETELLSLYRIGWLSAAERSSLYQSANQTGLSGSVCVERDHPASGRSGLIQAEIDRRREAARNADPLRKREEELRREQARVEKMGERLRRRKRAGCGA